MNVKNHYLQEHQKKEAEAVAYFKINDGDPVDFWHSGQLQSDAVLPPTLTLTLQPGGCMTFTDEQGNQFKLYVQAEK